MTVVPQVVPLYTLNNQTTRVPFFIAQLSNINMVWKNFWEGVERSSHSFSEVLGFSTLYYPIGSMMYVDFYGKFVGKYPKLHRSPEDCCVSIRRVAMWSHPPDQNNCSGRSWPFQVGTKEKMIFTVTWRVNHGIPRSLRENKKKVSGKRES